MIKIVMKYINIVGQDFALVLVKLDDNHTEHVKAWFNEEYGGQAYGTINYKDIKDGTLARGLSLGDMCIAKTIEGAIEERTTFEELNEIIRDTRGNEAERHRRVSEYLAKH